MFKKKGASEKSEDEKPEKPDEKSDKKGPPESVTTECESRIRTIIDKLDADGLKGELVEWQKNAAKFFMEDGRAQASTQLKVCAQRARALKENGFAGEFNRILIENTPTEINLDENSDPYPYELKEDHALMAGKMKESATGLPAGKAAPKGDAMGAQDDKSTKKEGPTYTTANPEATLAAGSGKIATKKLKETSVSCVVCPECKSRHDIVNCLKENSDNTGLTC
jgi:hypothetical protein